MTGAAGLSQLAIAFHRAGIPEEVILTLHKSIEEGGYVLMLRGAGSELEQWREVLESGSPSYIYNLPYSRVIDKDFCFPITTV